MFNCCSTYILNVLIKLIEEIWWLENTQRSNVWDQSAFHWNKWLIRVSNHWARSLQNKAKYKLNPLKKWQIFNVMLLIQWVSSLPFLWFFTQVKLTKKDDKERYYSADHLTTNNNYCDLFKGSRKVVLKLNER